MRDLLRPRGTVFVCGGAWNARTYYPCFEHIFVLAQDKPLPRPKPGRKPRVRAPVPAEMPAITGATVISSDKALGDIADQIIAKAGEVTRPRTLRGWLTLSQAEARPVEASPLAIVVPGPASPLPGQSSSRTSRSRAQRSSAGLRDEGGDGGTGRPQLCHSAKAASVDPPMARRATGATPVFSGRRDQKRDEGVDVAGEQGPVSEARAESLHERTLTTPGPAWRIGTKPGTSPALYGNSRSAARLAPPIPI